MKALCKASLGALALALLLCGCGPHYEYRYNSPRSDVGRSCVAGCNSEHRQCKRMDQIEQQHKEALYREQQRTAQYCREGKDKKQARSCPQADYRLNFRTFSNCGGDYDRCFLACGGNIEPVLIRE